MLYTTNGKRLTITKYIGNSIFDSLLLKRLKEAGIVNTKVYAKIITLLVNTIYLPFEMMLAATEYIREDAKNAAYDHAVVDALCKYWRGCITQTRRFHKRLYFFVDIYNP